MTPVDVLEHDDRVVHHDADQQQQAEQRHLVERETEEEHRRDRAEQRHRDGGCDDQRRAEVAQEEPDDEGREQRAFDQVVLQRGDDLADRRRVVRRNAQRHAGRQLRQYLALETSADVVHELHRVEVAHLHDADADGRLAVEAQHRAVVRERVLDLADVAQADRRAVRVADDHFAERLRAVELEVELDQVLVRAAHQETARHLHVLGTEGVADVLGRDTERGHPLRVHVDPDRPSTLAADVDLADAVDGLEPFLDHLSRVLVQLLRGAVALQRKPHHGRCADLDLEHDGRVGIVRQLPQHLVDLRLHLGECDVDVLRQLEGQHYVRDAGR